MDHLANISGDAISNSVIKSVIEKSGGRTGDKNISSLKNMISYLYNLKNKREINEKQFDKLISVVCSNYIENEMDKKIVGKFNKIIEDYLHYLI